MTTPTDRIGGYSAANGERNAKDTAAAMGGAAAAQIADAAGQAQHVAEQQLDRLAEAIRNKPIQAAGIAAGIGFVLAMLSRRG
jgi:ElaB/YqjD/DUF883 family membrane-anchored ribosome-binding protein